MKKKIFALLMTLVLALSATSMTAFAEQVPEWVNDIFAKVDACAYELESTDGTQFTSDMVLMGGSLDALFASLDDPQFEVSSTAYPMYSIKGDKGALTYHIDVTLDEEGDVFGVQISYYVGADLVANIVYNRNHDTTLVPMKAPTATEDGYMAYYACECGMFFKDAAATNKIADIDAWKTTPGQGLIHKLSPVESTTKATTTAKAKTTKADTSKKSPKTGATTMGLGIAGLGIALLALQKKKED